MGDVLRGSPWEILRAFLSLDVLLRLRTIERYWNKDDNYRPYGDFFHFLLQSGGHDASIVPVEGHSTYTQHQVIGALRSESESSGSLSSDLGEIWGYGRPTSPSRGGQSAFEALWPTVAAAEYCTKTHFEWDELWTRQKLQTIDVLVGQKKLVVV